MYYNYHGLTKPVWHFNTAPAPAQPLPRWSYQRRRVLIAQLRAVAAPKRATTTAEVADALKITRGAVNRNMQELRNCGLVTMFGAHGRNDITFLPTDAGKQLLQETAGA